MKFRRLAILILGVIFLAASGYAAPSIQLFSPLGGENKSTTVWITWQASDSIGFSNNPVSIYLSLNGGIDYTLYQSNTENDGGFNMWVDTKPDTTEARVKVQIINNNGEIASAESGNFNIISAPRVYFRQYLSAAVTAGTTQEISWWSQDAGNDLLSDSINIYYSADGGANWDVVASALTNEGAYNWQVPTEESYYARIKLEGRDQKGNIGYSVDDFIILAAPLTISVTEPQGGAVATAGQNINIKWQIPSTQSLQSYPYALYYSADDGLTYTKIVEGLDLDKWRTSYSWKAPAINTAKASIKITATDVLGDFIEGFSQTFSISDPPVPPVPPVGQIIRPNGGEYLKGGGTYVVSWETGAGAIEPSDHTVSLSYSINNGAWQSIAEGAANNGSYFWAVPPANSSSVKLRVEVLDGTGAIVSTDESSAVFAIDNTPPQISLTKPQAGSVLEIIDYVAVSYQVVENFGLANNGIKISFSVDGGLTVLKSDNDNRTNGENYSLWLGNVVLSDTSSAEIIVQATDKAGWVTTVESGLFTAVTKPRVNFIESLPSRLNGGQTYTIKWSATDRGNDLKEKPITIRYSINQGSTWEVIASNEANDGSYAWRVQLYDVSNWQGRIRIEAEDVNGNIGAVEQQAGIDSSTPEVRITKPASNLELKGNEPLVIEWNASDAGGVAWINLYYSIDNGATYLPIKEKSNLSSYTWTVPLLESDQVKIKVEAVDYFGRVGSAETAGQIKISFPALGTLTSPYAGQIVEAGATAEVKWYTGEGKIDPALYKVNISYLVTGEGQAWQTLAEDEDNDGSYILLVPDVATVLVALKLELVDNEGNIVAANDSGWFTIDGLPVVKIISPIGGEQIVGGSSYQINWEGSDGSGLLVFLLMYSVDGGQTYSPINYYGEDPIRYANSDRYYHNWTVPLIDTSEAKVQIFAMNVYGGENAVDESDAVFSIRTPVLGEVIAPNGGETLYAGNSYSIRWRASDVVEITADLYYQVNDGAWEVIASNEANYGYKNWAPPASAVTDKGKIKVVLKYGDGILSTDESDDYFSIATYSYNYENNISITAPASGEVLKAGSTYRVSWEVEGDPQSYENNQAQIYLTYYSEGTLFFAMVTEEVALKAGYYDWKIPSIATTTATMEIYSYSDGSFRGTSAIFSIISPPPETIITPALGEVIAPNGGEILYTNSPSSIKWQSLAPGVSAQSATDYTANLYYQVNDGTWETIAVDQANTGYYYQWMPPASAISDQVKIKIELKRDGEIISSDESDDYCSVKEYSYTPEYNLIITAPASGETLQAGSTYRIAWKNKQEDLPLENLSAQIVATYQSEGTLFYALITEETALAAGYYDWRVPSISTDSATIEMYAYGPGYSRGRSAVFAVTAPPPEPIIITQEVEPITRLEDGRGNKVILFDGALPPGTVVRIATTEAPARLFRGSSLASDVVEITAGGATLAKPINLSLKLKNGSTRPRPFYFDPVSRKWSGAGLEIVEQGIDYLAFSTTHLSIFAVFDVLDVTAPRVGQITIDGTKVKDGALITSRPRLNIEVDDDFGVDMASVRLIVDRTNTITESEGLIRVMGTTDSLDYVFTESNKLAVGSHTFQVVAADEAGNSSVSQIELRVMGDELAAVYVYPNPYTLGDSLGVVFAGTSISSNEGGVRIYDIAGQLVWSQTFNQPPNVNWNARNNAGNPVAAGIYMYLITTNSGGQKVGKIAIIN